MFITFEGPEGAGKTTIIQLVKEQLEKEGKKVLVTREPGGIRIAEKIREVILDVNHIEMDAWTEALLYAAARRQHLVEKIEPALVEYDYVICDRFIDSSLAYQGYARDLGIEKIEAINTFAIQDFMPNKTILLDVSPEVGIQRIKKNENREVNRLDLESLSFHCKVREGYLLLARKYNKRIQVINAEQSIEEVVKSCLDSIKG